MNHSNTERECNKSALVFDQSLITVLGVGSVGGEGGEGFRDESRDPSRVAHARTPQTD